MQLDYGYPWWLSYGHVTVLVPAIGMFALAYWLGWSRWAKVFWAAVAVWAVCALLVMRFVIDVNGEPSLPTQAFLASKPTARVLDLGAGTGRSSIMVLRSRPQATLVASDLFGDSFDHHFGPGDTPEARLGVNLRAAGVDKRAQIARADMRKLPFEAASFDGIVSAYAVDHLNRQGIGEALREAHRVLKPDGEFLLLLVSNDAWVKFAFGPALSHGGTRGAGWWKERMGEAGFDIAEEGTRPLTLYLLARRR